MSRVRHLQEICRTLHNRGKCRPVRHISPIGDWTREIHNSSPNWSGRQRQADFATADFAHGGFLERWKTLICNKLGRKMTWEVTVSVVGSRSCALHEVKDLCWQGELGWLSASQAFPPHWPMRARCPRSLKQAHPVCPPTAFQNVYKDQTNAQGYASHRAIED